MYPVVYTVHRDEFIRVHGHAARKAFMFYKTPILVGKKHSLKNMFSYHLDKNHPTFDHVMLYYRRFHCEKKSQPLWFFIHISFIKTLQKKIPGLIQD